MHPKTSLRSVLTRSLPTMVQPEPSSTKPQRSQTFQLQPQIRRPLAQASRTLYMHRRTRCQAFGASSASGVALRRGPDPSSLIFQSDTLLEIRGFCLGRILTFACYREPTSTLVPNVPVLVEFVEGMLSTFHVSHKPCPATLKHPEELLKHCDYE